MITSAFAAHTLERLGALAALAVLCMLIRDLDCGRRQ